MCDRGGIFMSKQEQYEFEKISDFIRGEISRIDVAHILEMSPRNVSRIANKVKKLGMLGVKHGNTGKRPVNKIDRQKKLKATELLQEHYFDFNIVHAREMLKDNHDLKFSYTSLRRIAHKINLVKHRKKSRRKARKYRVRMPCRGIMLQMDGSHHDWNGRDKWALIAAIDDATSEIHWAEFFTSEDTLNCMTVLQRIIEKVGIPECMYVDKAGWFGGTAKRPDFANFVRACEELGIKVIFANSPEAKGRIERTWQTFQDRLVPEFRLYNIKHIPAANKYLKEIFLPNYWTPNNTVQPRNPEDKFRPVPANINLNEVMCLKDFRLIKGNQTVSIDAKIYVIKDDPRFGSLKGLQIEIRTYQNLQQKYFFADKVVELIQVVQPLRYNPMLNGKKGSAPHEARNRKAC